MLQQLSIYLLKVTSISGLLFCTIILRCAINAFTIITVFIF